MSETKNVENGEDFYNQVSFQIIPVRISAVKKFINTAFIRVFEKIGKIFMRVIEQ